MFGHMEQKATCLWLKNLPKLKETNNVKAEMMQLPKREREIALFATITNAMERAQQNLPWHCRSMGYAMDSHHPDRRMMFHVLHHLTNHLKCDYANM
jgi:hypothetical protein